MDKSVDSIGTCSLDVDASGDAAAAQSEASSVATLRSVSLLTPSPDQPHLPSYLSLACTVNGYSTTTNYDPERLSKSREPSPHRAAGNEQNLTKYSVRNNLLSPPNVVPLPETMAAHQVYRTSKTMTFTSVESRFSSVYVSEAVDGCYENGVYARKETYKAVNGTAGRENVESSKSFIQQRVERLYGPGALAQGFFVMKRQQRTTSESEHDRLRVSQNSNRDKHSKSMSDRLLVDGDEDTVDGTTLPVLRHLRPEFRAQLPIVSTRKSTEMQKSITVPKLKEEVNGVNGHGAVGKGSEVRGCVSEESVCGAKEEVEKDGHYFLDVLSKEAERLLKLADTAEKEADDELLSEEVRGKLRSAYGKARLLVSQKMEQFKGLCSNNINQSKNEQFPTTNEDLQGFWDMVMLQVVQVNELFNEIDAIRKNNWQIQPEANSSGDTSINGTAKRSVKKVVVRPKTSGSEELRKQRDAQRKLLMEERRRAMRGQKMEEKNVEIFVPELS